MIGDREGRPPKSCSKRNEEHGKQNKNDGIAKGHQPERTLNKKTNPSCGAQMLDRIENFAVQRVQGRPLRLLRGEKMTARCGKNVGPPMSRGNEQQHGDKHRVWREKETDFAVRETKGPGEPRGNIVSNAAG